MAAQTAPQSPFDKAYREAAARSFDPERFADSARDYFKRRPEDREPNATLTYFEQAMLAYFEARGQEIDRRISEVNSRRDYLDNQLRGIDTRLTDIVGRLDAFNDTIGDPARALEGFRASIAEGLKLQEARKLWTDAASQAKTAYIWSWIALITLLVAIPAIGILERDFIFSFFKQVGDAVVSGPAPGGDALALVSAVSRLVLVTLPVALYVWLVRIVARFNMRSLLLMDDARQRNTMLETYLHLVEQDADVKADRPLILEALFRRTPGHGPDTIEPVNLADVLKIGAPGK